MKGYHLHLKKAEGGEVEVEVGEAEAAEEWKLVPRRLGPCSGALLNEGVAATLKVAL